MQYEKIVVELLLLAHSHAILNTVIYSMEKLKKFQSDIYMSHLVPHASHRADGSIQSKIIYTSIVSMYVCQEVDDLQQFRFSHDPYSIKVK